MKTIIFSLVSFFFVFSTFAAATEPPEVIVQKFSATPNPIVVPVGETLGVTTVSWEVLNATGIDVRVNSPTGPLFASGTRIGQATTAKWVTNGMQFFLINKATGLVLSTFTVAVQNPPAKTGQISANPAVCTIPAGSSLCTSKITWSTSGVTSAVVKIGGNIFTSGISGSADAPWIQQTPAVFELWGDGILLNSVSVIGTKSTTNTFSRTILDPYNVVDPTGMFLVDHLGKYNDKFYLQARYQRPTAATSPVQFQTDYNTVPNTGLGPMEAKYQRGPLGGSQAQSTYQLKGTEVGVLMRSFDSPHPSKLAICQPNCSGYQKHTVYTHHWTNAPLVFTSPNFSRALEIEADFQVKQFEAWSTIDNGPPRGTLAGQFAIVLFLEDPTGKLIQYVIFAFDSSPTTNNGGETVSLEIIGAGNNGYFIGSSFKKARPMTYTTVVPSNIYEFSHLPWTGFRNFKIQLTPLNISNAISELNRRGGALSTDIWKYKVREIAINHEVFYLDNGDAWVMGASTRNLKLREVGP